MPGRGNDKGGNGGRGRSGNNGSPYTIDETVELKQTNDSGYYSWDIEEDLSADSEYSLRAISRNSRNRIEAFLIPKEELDALKNGENFWYEYRTGSDTELSTNFTVNLDDEKPFYHDGDLILAITGTVQKQPAKVSVKFAKRD